MDRANVEKKESTSFYKFVKHFSTSTRITKHSFCWKYMQENFKRQIGGQISVFRG